MLKYNVKLCTSLDNSIALNKVLNKTTLFSFLAGTMHNILMSKCQSTTLMYMHG